MIWCEQSTENLSGRYLVDIRVVYFDDSRCLAFVVCDSSPYGVIVAPHDGNVLMKQTNRLVQMIVFDFKLGEIKFDHKNLRLYF